MEPQHYHEDLAAFALNALDQEERRAVEAHIAVCLSCRLVVEETRCIVDQLALAAPLLKPSPRLKQRLMARIADERPAARPAPVARSWRLLGAGMAAALLVLLLVNLQMNARLNHISSEQQQLAQQRQIEWEILAQPDGVSQQLVSVQGGSPASGAIYMQPNGRQAMLVVDGLEPLEPGEVYRCWLMRNGQSDLAATFNVSEQGHAGVILQARDMMTSYRRLLITVERSEDEEEPEPKPKGKPILAADL